MAPLYANPLEAAVHREPLNNVILYSAPLVIPITSPVIVDGAVAVCDGHVVHVGTRQWVLEQLQQDMALGGKLVEQHWDGVITPGLINAHTHLQYTNMAAVGSGQYSSFHNWELGFNDVYDDLCEHGDWCASAYEGARMMVESGTTAAADIVTDSQAAGALASQNMHGIAYWEVMDWGNSDWRSQGVRTLVDHLGQFTEQRIPSIGISPHAPYSLEADPFVDLPSIARRLNMRLHIHLAETPMEAGDHEHVLSTYSTSDWRDAHWDSYTSLKNAGTGASAIQFLDQLGSLGPDVHIAHGVWADAEDRRILRQRGVSVALCPRSNRITVTGKDAPIRAYLEEGNMLSVGTDSLSSSPSLDVLSETALLYDLAREQGYSRPDLTHRLIRIATMGGAEAMGMHVGPGRIGQINSGAMADLALFDIPLPTRTAAGIEESLETLVRYGAGSARATIISGDVKYNAGALADDPSSPRFALS